MPSSLNRADGADTDNNSADFARSTTVTPRNSGGPGPDPTPTPSRVHPGRSRRSRAPVTRAASWARPSRRAASSRRPTRRAVSTVCTSRPPLGRRPGPGDAHRVGGPLRVLEVRGIGAAGRTARRGHGRRLGVFRSDAGHPAANGWTVLTDPAEVVKPANVAFPRRPRTAKLEGMLVQPAGDYVVADNYDTNYYGSVVLASGTSPLQQPTAVGRPGAGGGGSRRRRERPQGHARRRRDDELQHRGQQGQAAAVPDRRCAGPRGRGGDLHHPGGSRLPLRRLELPARHRADPANAAAVQPATFANTRTASPRTWAVT
ncbi:hypothetical protein NKG05_08675 [Oerskovia sp. M15]